MNIPTYAYSILCGTVLFVIGQYFLRKSFDKDDDYINTWLIFNLTFGIIACIATIWLRTSDENYITNILSDEKMQKLLYAVDAGFFFAFGNIFWIYSISTKNSIGGIRTIMAGIETILLLLLGFVMFSETFTAHKIIGIGMVLSGIYVLA